MSNAGDDYKGKKMDPPNMKVDLSKYDNISLSDLHLDVKPRIKNIIEELFHEHNWSWPTLPAKDVRKARLFKRKKNKLFYNSECQDFATILSLLIGPLELFIAIGFGLVPKTFVVAMRESAEIVALIICVFFFQGIYHTYSAILGFALRASRPFEIGFIFPIWKFEIAFPLLGIFSVFACFYMSQSWMVEKEMYVHLKGYNFHWYSKSMWDSYQTYMKCCGITSYKDWESYGPLLYDDKHAGNLPSVPESCCSVSNCTYSPNSLNVWSVGCRDQTLWILWGFYGAGGLCVFVSLILLCLGIRSTREASRYAGDPMHKLLFDDRWSKKRMYNRSNRREELFFLLNRYCLILGKELGFDEEVEAAKREESERHLEFDQEMESDKERYESSDTYTGNSPPTPSSFDNINVDDMYVPEQQNLSKEPKVEQWKAPQNSNKDGQMPIQNPNTRPANDDGEKITSKNNDVKIYSAMVENYELLKPVGDEKSRLPLLGPHDYVTKLFSPNPLNGNLEDKSQLELFGHEISTKFTDDTEDNCNVPNPVDEEELLKSTSNYTPGNQVLSIVALERRPSQHNQGEYGPSYIELHITDNTAESLERTNTKIGIQDVLEEVSECRTDETSLVHLLNNNDRSNTIDGSSTSSAVAHSSTFQVAHNDPLDFDESVHGESNGLQRTSSLTNFHQDEGRVLVARKSSSEFSGITQISRKKEAQKIPFVRKRTQIPVLMTKINIPRRTLPGTKKVTIIDPKSDIQPDSKKESKPDSKYTPKTSKSIRKPK